MPPFPYVGRVAALQLAILLTLIGAGVEVAETPNYFVLGGALLACALASWVGKR